LYRVPALAGIAVSAAKASAAIPNIPFMSGSVPNSPGIAKRGTRPGYNDLLPAALRLPARPPD